MSNQQPPEPASHHLEVEIHRGVLLKHGFLLEVLVMLPDAIADKRQQYDVVETWALIDTGAGMSAISPGIAAALKLPRIGSTKVSGAYGPPQDSSIYPINFAFKHMQFRMVNHPVVEADLSSGAPYQVVVGRDFLQFAALTYDGYSGKITMEFPSPSHPSHPRQQGPEEPDASESTPAVKPKAKAKARAKNKMAKRSRKANR